MRIRARPFAIGLAIGWVTFSIGLLIIKGTSALPLILGLGTGDAVGILIVGKLR